MQKGRDLRAKTGVTSVAEGHPGTTSKTGNVIWRGRFYARRPDTARYFRELAYFSLCITNSSLGFYPPSLVRFP